MNNNVYYLLVSGGISVVFFLKEIIVLSHKKYLKKKFRYGWYNMGKIIGTETAR